MTGSWQSLTRMKEGSDNLKGNESLLTNSAQLLNSFFAPSGLTSGFVIGSKVGRRASKHGHMQKHQKKPKAIRKSVLVKWLIGIQMRIWRTWRVVTKEGQFVVLMNRRWLLISPTDNNENLSMELQGAWEPTCSSGAF